MTRIKCMKCGKEVSSEVPDGTVIMAYVECPECAGNNGTFVITGEVVLPSCWKDLIEAVIDENTGDGDKIDHADDDPTPYYDDNRIAMPVRLSNGTELTVYLCSGQSNYWSSFDIMRDGVPVYESEPLDSFPSDDMIVVNQESDSELMKDVEYRIKIVWV